MSELIKNFLTIALCGSLIGIIIPENKLEKNISFISSAVILLTMLTLFANLTKTIDLKNLNFNFSDNNLKTDTQQEVIRGIKYSLENEINNITEKYTGEKPLNIEIEIVYEGGEFILNYIKVYIRNGDETSLSDHIRNTLNIDTDKTNIIIEITENAYITTQ
jgi:hypothetical protein